MSETEKAHKNACREPPKTDRHAGPSIGQSTHGCEVKDETRKAEPQTVAEQALPSIGVGVVPKSWVRQPYASPGVIVDGGANPAPNEWQCECDGKESQGEKQNQENGSEVEHGSVPSGTSGPLDSTPLPNPTISHVALQREQSPLDASAARSTWYFIVDYQFSWKRGRPASPL